MAGEIAITPANVQPGSGIVLRGGICAATSITAGMAIYMDSDDGNRLKACDADVEASAKCIGIAMNGAAENQPLAYQNKGTYTVGGTVVAGQPYVLSQETSGSIKPFANLDVGDYCTTVIMAISMTVAEIAITITGATKA